jgi:VanZ family protein
VVDSVVNVGIFVPLGWGLRRLFPPRVNGALAVLGVGLLGAQFSVTMETLQHFLPMRYSSIFDVAANTIGTIVGGLATPRRR